MKSLKPNDKRTATAGVEWCINLNAEIHNRMDEVGCLEIIPESFFSDLGNFNPAKLFDRIQECQTPVIIHSIGLSLGSIEAFKQDHFKRIQMIADKLPTKISLSDHLCMTERNGSEIGQLTPTPYNQETLDCISWKLELIQKQMQVPFAIENIAHPFMIPDQDLSETEFLNKLINRTGVGILLDLNNIYSNGVNFGIDPYQWLSEIDLKNVQSIHLAGGYIDGDNFLQDGHCARVPTPVWALYDKVINGAGRSITTIVERTWRNEGTGLSPILEDQNMAQRVLDECESNTSQKSELSHSALLEAYR